MILKRLQASFGKLDGAVLTLQPGLNLLYAPNEGGKSTWCAFLLAMLYGIDASQRDSKAADDGLHPPCDVPHLGHDCRRAGLQHLHAADLPGRDPPYQARLGRHVLSTLGARTARREIFYKKFVRPHCILRQGVYNISVSGR